MCWHGTPDTTAQSSPAGVRSAVSAWAAEIRLAVSTIGRVLDVSKSYAQTYNVTVPDEAAARAVADRLAERGHRLVAIRIVDHFSFDPSSHYYGKPSMRPEYAGWWDVFSVVVDPAAADDAEWLRR